MCIRDMWVVQCYCILGVKLYWKLIAKIMGVVCEVVAGFQHGVIFIGCWY